MAFSDARTFEHARLGVPYDNENEHRYVTGGRIKRALDVVIATAAIVVVSPLMAILSLLLWATGSPVFSRQRKFGKSGVEFAILRFHVDRQKRLGRFLGKSGFAVLPMLLNVLAGQMSLVGPEPKELDDLKLSNKFSGLYVKVRPGMTGRWFVSPESTLGEATRMRIDRDYINNGTLWCDVNIVLKSPFAFYINR